MFVSQTIFFFQIYLNYLANYVPNIWTYERGCTVCDQDMLDLSQFSVSKATRDSKSSFLFMYVHSISGICQGLCSCDMVWSWESCIYHSQQQQRNNPLEEVEAVCYCGTGNGFLVFTEGLLRRVSLYMGAI